MSQLANKFKSILKKSLKELGIFGLASGMATLDTAAKLLGVSDWESLTKIVNNAEQGVKNRRHELYRDITREAKEDFRKLTQAASKRKGGRPLVVFLDDLDRCLPDNALSILGAMKNLFVVDGAQVIFLCGIDTDVAKQFIKSRYQGIESDFAINYFKKIFNHTIEVPRVPPDNCKRRLVLYIADLFNLSSTEEAERIAAYVLRLSDLAGNRSLRSIFNVVNQYFVTQLLAGKVTNAGSVIAVLWLRERWHGFYEELVTEAKKFDGTAQLRTVLSSPVLRAARTPQLQAYLGKVGQINAMTIAKLNELNLL